MTRHMILVHWASGALGLAGIDSTEARASCAEVMVRKSQSDMYHWGDFTEPSAALIALILTSSTLAISPSSPKILRIMVATW